VKVKLLPVPQSTNFSGISLPARIDEVVAAAVHRHHVLDIEHQMIFLSLKFSICAGV
jgi:hypothetical protein